MLRISSIEEVKYVKEERSKITIKELYDYGYISPRTFRALARDGWRIMCEEDQHKPFWAGPVYLNVDDLMSASDEEILHLRNIGQKSLEEIKLALEAAEDDGLI